MRTTAITLLLAASAAWAGKSSHPHFDDRGTLQWFTELEKAQAAARKQGKVIFVEYGRKP
ncbi:MAG: hypothetical protein AAGD14_03600 [Planctomycetota bacterium]